LEQARAVVKDGGVIVFPTDTVYGIGCDPACRPAIDRIYALKGRSREKPLALYFAHVGDLLPYVLENERALALARRFLPGPLTLVISRPAAVDSYLVGGLPTVGLRVPQHELAQTLLAQCGPLAATSANQSGAEPFTGGAAFNDVPGADLLLDGGPSPLGVASTVVDLSEAEPRLIREGTLPYSSILQALQAC
jgi:L-threonylcarbamoyladenylate synthase